MSELVRVAIAGLGTVGAETYKLLQNNAANLKAFGDRKIKVVAVSARNRGLERGLDLSQVEWCDDVQELGRRSDIDIVIELIGGAGGPAKTLVENALKNKKAVVTANKALVAHHGLNLAKLAERSGTTLAFEAAVAGGIPIIKTMREGLRANNINRIYGILNGTCNYILTVMRETGRPFDEVLSEAQTLGYAESDPSFDIDGIDAAHKLAILASLAFGTEINFDAVHIEGIRYVSTVDLEFAEELGFRIKLLGIAERISTGIQQRVRPCMVPINSLISSVEGVFNGVGIEGSSVGETLLYGRGAGGSPTASAVIADVLDIVANRSTPVFGIPSRNLKSLKSAEIESLTGSYYLRLKVFDRPGVLADLTAVFRDEKVSVEALLQRGREPGESVPVVLTTHEAEEAAIRRSVTRIGKLASVVETPRIIRIEVF